MKIFLNEKLRIIEKMTKLALENPEAILNEAVAAIFIIKMALEGHSGGITVSTFKEAEYYFDFGIADIVYAVGIAPSKFDRIASLINKESIPNRQFCPGSYRNYRSKGRGMDLWAAHRENP
ncbi:MAG: hypothetical protein CVV64_15280 [Candidatus Wallbacteria bacterium HGW-Wallbacteria-1]|jgi:hypothetical protein|uniref:Uncharacterized protein n=1 Tax=Candidatus Wallbacteria bacterium HGW-Wallbacteria-1 TaxID=2013854 RepID=A0A2N1PLP6_9BACT|nr:MAG: hypothetical protein CVV64_15280 [Candidatus Wallbacteria bacterium HGW-Wallbacteria-1]